MLYNQQAHVHGGQHVGAWKRAAASASKGGPSRKDIISDIFAVVLWGASVPVLMWLGAAAGF
ncbi:MAG TPA: hypothetical protein VK104_05980 [Burkholderiaceae bacterium]|nr:hypothetical protein [Burkholderiaceae bacterium]